jgi:cytochrome P450
MHACTQVMLRVEEIRAAGPSTPVNLSVMFHSITNSVVSRAAFGKKRKNAAEFLAATKAVVGLSSGFNIPDLFPAWTTVLAKLTGMTRSLKEIHKTVDTILEEIIEERKRIRDEKIMGGAAAEDVDENLVDVLIGLQEKGGFGFQLTNSIIKAIILVIYSILFSPTRSPLIIFNGNTYARVHICAGHVRGRDGDVGVGHGVGDVGADAEPAGDEEDAGADQRAFRGKTVVTEGDLQASNLQYMKLVIKEALRLHPPAPLLVPRESIEECELDGYTIPAKSRVIINAWAIGRDPKYWVDADEFKPERFEDGSRDFTGSSYEFLPFGSGRRMCPGFNYGLASMELAFVGLLYHFDWSLPEGVKEVDMGEAPGLGVRRRTPLMLCATPFVPVPA